VRIPTKAAFGGVDSFFGGIGHPSTAWRHAEFASLGGLDSSHEAPSIFAAWKTKRL
jgi:hypothetical protein